MQRIGNQTKSWGGEAIALYVFINALIGLPNSLLILPYFLLHINPLKNLPNPFLLRLWKMLHKNLVRWQKLSEIYRHSSILNIAADRHKKSTMEKSCIRLLF